MCIYVGFKKKELPSCLGYEMVLVIAKMVYIVVIAKMVYILVIAKMIYTGGCKDGIVYLRRWYCPRSYWTEEGGGGGV